MALPVQMAGNAYPVVSNLTISMSFSLVRCPQLGDMMVHTALKGAAPTAE